MALARTTLFNSVFISATVCRTVASKFASSNASTPAFAWPRATRPTREKMSERNAISSLLVSPCLFSQAAQYLPRRHYIHQQKMHAGYHIVLVLRTHILYLAEVVQGHRYIAAPRIVKLEAGSADPIVGGQHARHDLRRNRGARHRDARHRQKQNVAFEYRLDGDAAIHFANLNRGRNRFRNVVSLLRQDRVYLAQVWAGCWCHRIGQLLLLYNYAFPPQSVPGGFLGTSQSAI